MRLLRKIAVYLLYLLSLLMMMKGITEIRPLVNGTSGSWNHFAAWFVASMLTAFLSSAVFVGWTATLRQFREAFRDWDVLVNKH